MKRFLSLLAVVTLLNINLFAKGNIKGTVLDKNNEPLVGVQVMSNSSDIATTTDLDGRFEIDVPEGTELIFSMLGSKSVIKAAENGMIVIMKVNENGKGRAEWRNPLWHNILLAEYGMNVNNMGSHSLGIRYGMCRYAGWYVGARYVTSDFTLRKVDGTMDSNGLITEPAIATGHPFMTGSSQFNQITASAGLLWRMFIPLYGYVGAGYGYRQTVYETTGNNWLKRQNDKTNLLTVEFGLVGDIHQFTISAGCEIMFAESMELYPKIGIGYTFPIRKSKSKR